MLFLLVLAAVTGVWACHHAQQGVDTITSWWITISLRFLAGGQMVRDIYEINPPLVIFAYMPPALLIKYLHFTLYGAAWWYALALSVFSIALCRKLVAAIDIGEDSRFVFLVSWVIACTLVPAHHFSDREHLLMLGLMPLVLAQICITRGRQAPGIYLIPAILFGSIFLLLKPQYIAVPGMIILHRMIVRRSLRPLLDIDTLLTGAVTLAYLAAVFTVFRGYVTVILPDMAVLYIAFLRDSILPLALALAAIIGAMCAVTALSESPQKWFILVMLGLCLWGVCSFVMEGKLWYYHLVPALMFFTGGAGLFLYQAVMGGHPDSPYNKEALGLALYCTLLFGIAANLDRFSPYMFPSVYERGGNVRSPPYTWPSHQDHINAPLVELVRKYASGKSYFIFGSMAITQLPSVYTDSVFASRFPVLWFLPGMVDAEQKLKRHEPAAIAAANLDLYKKKYGAMVGEDFRKYSPAVVILARMEVTDSPDSAVTFEKYFSFDPVFAREWPKYKKIKTLKVDSRDYYGGYQNGSDSEYADYDVYVKK